jgi:uncharacterized protein
MQRLVIVIFLIFCFVPFFSLAEGRWEEPWGLGNSGNPGGPAESSTAGQKIAQGALKFYQKYISAVDGDRCPSYPTCSHYAAEAVRKHGAVLGALMAFDRLMHEADEVQRAPLVRVGDRERYFDPVENNDFWWKKAH